MPVRQSIIWKILLGVYIAGLFFCCFWNFRGSIDLNMNLFKIHFDKIMHFLLFLPFPIICHSAFPKINRKLWFFPAVFCIGLLLGAGIEWLQGLSGYRSNDVWDLLADSIGLATAILFVAGYEWMVSKKRNV